MRVRSLSSYERGEVPVRVLRGAVEGGEWRRGDFVGIGFLGAGSVEKGESGSGRFLLRTIGGKFSVARGGGACGAGGRSDRAVFRASPIGTPWVARIRIASRSFFHAGQPGNSISCGPLQAGHRGWFWQTPRLWSWLPHRPHRSTFGQKSSWWPKLRQVVQRSGLGIYTLTSSLTRKEAS